MKTNINLLPKELRSKYKKIPKWIEQKVKIIIAIIGIIILLKIGLNIVGRNYARNIKKIEQELSSYQTKWEQIKEETKIIEQLKKRIEEKNKKIKAIDDLLGKKIEVCNWLKTISLNIPEQVWLTEITFSKDKEYILLDGFGISNLLISKFLTNLQASEDFSQVLLESTEKVDTSHGKFLKFMATGKLK